MTIRGKMRDVRAALEWAARVFIPGEGGVSLYNESLSESVRNPSGERSEVDARGRSHLERGGSVTILALIALAVLGVIIGAFYFTLGSRYRQVHHAYYYEKSLALIEGLNAIARGEAQRNLSSIIEANGAEVELPGVEERARQLHLLDSDEDVSYDIRVTARILTDPGKIKYFKDTSPYSTLREETRGNPEGIFQGGEEMEGIVEIRARLSMEGVAGGRFSIPPQTIVTQYEFKRLKRVPPFFRHFTLFVKNALTEEENPDSYTQRGAFNHVLVPMDGTSANGGVLFLDNGRGLGRYGIPKVPPGPATPAAKAANPFYSSVGYVYLGGEGRTFLNLTAGDRDALFSESFQLYRGVATNFYKVWDIDFTNFIEKAQMLKSAPSPTGAGGEQGWIRRAWNWIREKVRSFVGWLKRSISYLASLDALEYSGKAPRSANLPLYYIVRKDIGYAVEFGRSPKFRRFGFRGGSGDSEETIYCNCLHLYGTASGQSPVGACVSPTLVLGNVYRRHLSLAGYKQRRSTANPSVRRKYEVQAGPIEYFKRYSDLMRRTSDPTAEGDSAPIWVWDARVDWNGATSRVNGVYMPISGAALFGRLIPGMARLWEDDKSLAIRLFRFSIEPPASLGAGDPASYGRKIVDLEDAEEDVPAGISPIFVRMYRDGVLEAEDGFRYGKLYRRFSPYFEELMRCFCYSSFNRDMGDEDQGGMETRILTLAKKRWADLLEAVSTDPAVRRKVKPMELSSVRDPVSSRYVKLYWRPRANPSYQGSDGQARLASRIYPFSLPDPWSKKGRVPRNFQSRFERACSDKEKFFKKYFYHIMTNPAYVSPYNNSMRFMFEFLKNIFTKPPEERMKLLGDEILPEVRDGINFVVEGKNDYLKRDRDDRFNKVINDEVLKRIYARRKRDQYLQKGYFFMDDYGPRVRCPADVDIRDVFTGRRHCWKLTWDEFKERFMSADGKTVKLNTVVAVTDGVVFDSPVHIAGGGAIIAASGSGNGPVSLDGTIRIEADVTSDAPLLLVAKDISIGGETRRVEASLVCAGRFSLGGDSELVIRGNVVCDTLDVSSIYSSSGERVLVFDSRLKTDDSYVQNIEPRLHKFHIEGLK